MLKRFNKLFLFVVVILLFLFTCPKNIYALSQQYLDINDNIKNSTLKNLSYDSTGIVTNNDTKINIIPSKSSKYSMYDYVIDKYDVNIVVNENNTFNITETITAYFNVPKHGIFRTIPIKNKIIRLDGTTSTNHARVSNIDVDNEYTISKENGNYKIQIGSKDHEITGEQTYVIKYTYNLGKDPIKNYDELYYNIIGNEWDTVIGNVTFTIIMPKDFDSNKLGFSAGKKGSTSNDNIKYSVSENTIYGSYDGVLEVGQALTIRCELDDGYFVNAGLPFSLINYIIIFTPILFLMLALFLWFIFGRDDQVIETVEFYPPAGLNSLEVGYLYKGKADNKDVTSLLIYLANKGYIKIEEIEQNGMFSKSKIFKIIKLKEYDGNNLNEQIFFNGLFKKKRTAISYVKENQENNVDEVTFLDLYDNFYITINRILSNINSSENEYKIFEKKASSKKILIILMIILTYCLITIPPVINYGQFELLIFALLFPGISLYFILKTLFGNKLTVYVNTKATNSYIMTIIWALLFGGIPWLFLVLPSLLQETAYLVGYIIGIICIFGMSICLKYLPKRTKYGNQILGKLKGFKNFLETAEKQKLEALVMQEPEYFYNILPYTYVLGVSDKWIKKFESISLQSPTWYNGTNGFDITIFGAAMDNAMSSFDDATSYNSSDISSSGGGSSGDGSGGGGGGSW